MTNNSDSANTWIRIYNALCEGTTQLGADEWNLVASHLESYLPQLSGSQHEIVRSRAADARSRARRRTLSAH